MNNNPGTDSTYRQKPGDRVYRVRREKPWQISISPAPEKTTGPKASLWTLIYGFAGMIAIGAVLLMLPFSSKDGQLTPLIDAVFTATSSVCVTGLVVFDTLEHWTSFGQAVILVLIQFGGFGYMTITTLLLVALGNRIGLRERLLIGESVGISRIGGVVRLIRNVVIFSLAAEIIGAVIFYIRFSTDSPVWAAIWKSVFQSVSAFNNAGFDIFGNFSSLISFQSDSLVLLTTAGLVIMGGIGFLVVENVIRAKKPGLFSIDTKMVLIVTLILLVFGSVVVMITEYNNPATLGPMPLPVKILNAFFQSATSRTAGFSAINTGAMTEYALFFTVFLMFIGGASGSAAGGIKVNTFGLIIATIWSVFKGREHPGVFGREFATSQVFRALAVLILSFGVVGIVTFILSITENASFIRVFFEAVSAFGTVGLSTGITPDLSFFGRITVIITMFIGRLGPLTLTLALVRAQRVTAYRYPKEVLRIG